MGAAAAGYVVRVRTPIPLRPDDPVEAGPFRLLGRLAAGGMGVVYLARRDDRPESLVAMKLMRTDHAHQPLLRERFRAEVEATCRVAERPTTTTHVARLVDADADATTPWLATEFVPGPSVADAVAERPLDPHEVLEVARALADALVALHAEGLVHGDVKPANVVLGPDGVRLVDLGLARDAGDGLPTAMGSPGWAPPEARSPGHDGMPADVFGWGMTVAFAAGGAHPFGEGPTDELVRRMQVAAPRLDALPRLLRPLVAAALAPDPLARPTAGALSRTLHGGPRAAATAVAAAEHTQPLDEAVAATGTQALAAPTTVDEPLLLGLGADRPEQHATAAGTRDGAAIAALAAVALLVVVAIASLALWAGPGTDGVADELPAAPTPSAAAPAPSEPAASAAAASPTTKPSVQAAAPAAPAAPATGGDRAAAGGGGKAKGDGKDNGKGKGKGGGNGKP